MKKTKHCPLCQYKIPQEDGTRKKCRNYVACTYDPDNYLVCYSHLDKFDEVKQQLNKIQKSEFFSLAKGRTQIGPTKTINVNVYTERTRKIQNIYAKFHNIFGQYPLGISLIRGYYLLIMQRLTENIFYNNTPYVDVGSGANWSHLWADEHKQKFHLGKKMATQHGKLYTADLNNYPLVTKINPVYNASDLIMVGISIYIDQRQEDISKHKYSLAEDIEKYIPNETKSLLPESTKYDTIANFLIKKGEEFVNQNNDSLRYFSTFNPEDLQSANFLAEKIGNFFEYLKVNKLPRPFKVFFDDNIFKAYFIWYIQYKAYDYFKLLKEFEYGIYVLNFLKTNNMPNAFDPKFQQCRKPIEDAFFTNNASSLVLENHCPFFPILYATLFVRVKPDIKLETEIGKGIGVIKNKLNKDYLNKIDTPILKNLLATTLIPAVESEIYRFSLHSNFHQVLVMEKFDGLIKSEIDKFITSNMIDYQIAQHLGSIISQVLFALYSLQRYHQTHNNLNFNNIAFRRVHPNTVFFFQRTLENGTILYYSISSLGYEIKIINFENADGIVNGEIHQCNTRSTCRYDDNNGDIMYFVGSMYKIYESTPKLRNNPIFKDHIAAFKNILQCDSTKKFNLLEKITRCENNPSRKSTTDCLYTFVKILRCEKNKCDTFDFSIVLNPIDKNQIPSNVIIYKL